MADELDLTIGIPDAETDEDTASARRRLRRERAAAGEGKPRASRAKAREKDEGPDRESEVVGEIKTRLKRVLDRVAQWRDSRDDQELAAAVREDADMMVSGVVSIAKSIPPLRMPLVLLLGIAEPLLAFGRVARILIGRMVARRAAAAEEAAMQAAMSGEYVNSETGEPVYQR